MRTEDLIVDLAGRATPVRPLPSPVVRTIGWLAIAIVFVAVGIAAFGARPDLGARAGQVQFMWPAALALFTLVLAGLASLVLAIPGAERTPLLRVVILAVMAAWAGTIVNGVVHEGHGFAGVSDWYVCAIRIAAVGLVPGIALVSLICRAAPLKPSLTSALAIGAACAAGALAIQFVCPVDDAGHALLGHFGAVAGFSVIGAVAGRRLLRA